MLPNPFGITVGCTVVGTCGAVGSTGLLESHAASTTRLATATDARRSARLSKAKVEIIVGLLMYVVRSIGGSAQLRGGLGSATRNKRNRLTGFPLDSHPTHLIARHALTTTQQGRHSHLLSSATLGRAAGDSP